MPLLCTFPIPLPNSPPPGFTWIERPPSELSTTTAFDTGLDQRDRVLGRCRCIVCGVASASSLYRCHIIPQSRLEEETWKSLKEQGWLPSQAKKLAMHEPRNGLTLCGLHNPAFDTFRFFIRYVPEVRKFVLINISNDPDLHQFHGKAVALDVTDRHAPFPSLFIIHEMRATGFNPFASRTFDLPNIVWQDWLLNTPGALSNTDNPNQGGYFNRNAPQPTPGGAGPSQPASVNMALQAPGGRTKTSYALNDDVIAQILKATRESASWKACVIEGTDWSGTADENRDKYLSLFS